MTPTADPATGTTRRQLISIGALGAAATAFLAACAGTKSDRTAGQSGIQPTTTIAAPDAPLKDITEADRAEDTTLLRTATSLELLAAEQYKTYGPVLKDADWKANAARFAIDHAAAAKVFQGQTKPADQVDKPNEYLQKNTIDPIKDQLTDDIAILNFFADIESTLVATYATSVGQFTTASGRGQFAGFAEAAARRTALLGNGGIGSIPTTALYPLVDLIPNEAYVTVTKADADDAN